MPASISSDCRRLHKRPQAASIVESLRSADDDAMSIVVQVMHRMSTAAPGAKAGLSAGGARRDYGL